ncbi:RNA polymerase sigma-70 factor (ECF subfamily) [Mobilisporobacter senegalensis]|uniref:RNA polymerase sigma-70 factor (ECF subfamily) n=1 Tax=Mobilisporobacter senegalensis TaxID=1329262 RepID=A0A3N1XG21_9FIRM|nr:sigma-70 family RNA polymerase sigma factor [Mobilisporobacter senegalensis]ROR25659.1 RNA polymerase sigma-70 factor (ECF subfamily) [Mobilisporobacter senegalensis]
MKIKENNFMQELREGNEDALSYVIIKYGGLVMSIIQKHLYLMKDKQEECFDDIFINVWIHIENYDETQTEFKNWIAGVARNRAIDYLRKYKREIEELNFEEESIKLIYEDTLSLVENEISQETEKMLSCLSKKDRELLQKIYMEEIPVDILSQKTGMSKNLIYKRVSRSKQKIRRIYFGKEG